MKLNQVVEKIRSQSTMGLELAREYIKIPIPAELGKNRKEMTNKRILASLKKMGVATQAEVKILQSRLEKLEAKFAAQNKE